MRQTPYACASFAFVGVEVYEFQAGETLTQHRLLLFANGNWNAAHVETAAAVWQC